VPLRRSREDTRSTCDEVRKLAKEHKTTLYGAAHGVPAHPRSRVPIDRGRGWRHLAADIAHIAGLVAWARTPPDGIADVVTSRPTRPFVVRAAA